MKRTFKNELGEEFKMAKHLMRDIKSYQGRTSFWLYQIDDQSWEIGFSRAFCRANEEEWHYGIQIPIGMKITKKNLANWLGYYEC